MSEREKEENMSGYEKYSEWFKKIEKMCDSTNLVDQGLYTPGDISTFNRHYKINNGLHVYKMENGDTLISDENISNFYEPSYMKKMGNISISINTGKFAKISYGIEGRTAANGVGTGKDYSFLPSKDEVISHSQDKYEMTGNLNPNARELLSEAMDRAEDEEIKKEYERTIKLYDKINKLIERDNLKEELNTENQNDDRNTLKIGDLTQEKLEQMPIEDLENMLKSTENENSKKQKELENLKKKRLISQIREEIEKGKDLDSKIAKAKITNDIEK